MITTKDSDLSCYNIVYNLSVPKCFVLFLFLFPSLLASAYYCGWCTLVDQSNSMGGSEIFIIVILSSRNDVHILLMFSPP